jgi:hypothetical protein
MSTFKLISIGSLILIIFASSGFSDGMNYISGCKNTTNIISSSYTQFSATSPVQIQKERMKNRKLWKNTVKKSVNKKYPLRLLYDPRFLYYGGKRLEMTENLTVNFIIARDNDKEIKSDESTTEKRRRVSPPHMIKIEDIFPQRTENKNLIATKAPGTVILIRGTTVNEISVP